MSTFSGLLSASLTRLYHVTEAASAEAIKAEGFFGAWGDAGFGLYFYDNLHDAQLYARRGGWAGDIDDPVILAVEVPTALVRRIEVHPEWPNPEDYENVYFMELPEDDENARFKPVSVEVIPAERVRRRRKRSA